MPRTPVLVWFRHDLRTEDNPALHAAVQREAPIVPVFIWAPDEESPWAPGSASKWWLHHSLPALDDQLRALGSRLILRAGPTAEALQVLLRETGAREVFWNRRYEPAVLSRDKNIEASLHSTGMETANFNAALLREPWDITNQAGKPFRVFTPFWRHCMEFPAPTEPLPAPRRIGKPAKWPATLNLKDLKLDPANERAGGFAGSWQPGSASAQQQLQTFLRNGFESYAKARDLPAVGGTSRLSPHLHFGEISPRQVWHALARHAHKQGIAGAEWKRSQFVTELGWREFSHHLIYHFPHTDLHPLRTEFQKFRWRQNADWLRAWQLGRTGYPFIDAAMRELWNTGWMHNRARMAVASFLVKDLLMTWQQGAKWFWDTLVDADLAQNTLGWQWTAGCGADAAPFFRVFNPTKQGDKFDPAGTYIRRWVPELARLPDKWIHRPHEAPVEVLSVAKVELGKTYPEPILSHMVAREIALEAFARLKKLTRAES